MSIIKRRQRRTDEEWLRIITECRQSCLSDNAWFEQHEISLSSFYKAVSRLRNKACAVPESSRAAQQVVDLTSHQDVIQIDLCENHCPPSGGEVVQAQPAAHLDNPYMIELTAGSITLKVRNGTDASLLGQVLRLTEVISCQQISRG